MIAQYIVMDKDLYGYYESQLRNVSGPNRWGRNVQIKSDNKQTKWLGLNNESATALVKWLKEHYNVKEV